mmetsp:Transcript_14357/g.45275  ORF Transcript_14357/g.45275 Transcript_14357/m.45275 type:complete len:233 (-) Transcript_14357:376-1074(-)
MSARTAAKLSAAAGSTWGWCLRISRAAAAPSCRMSAPRTATRCRCLSGPSSTTMPASRRQREAASMSTNMFPGWRSPWTRLSWKIILQTQSTPRRESAVLVAWSARTRRETTSETGTPGARSSTRTSRDEREGRGRGTLTVGMLAKFSDSFSKFLASCSMSICLSSESPNSSTAAGSESHFADGQHHSTRCAAHRISARSVASIRLAAGWTTLTATASPGRESAVSVKTRPR